MRKNTIRNTISIPSLEVFPNHIEEEVVLFSEMEGHITFNGKPIKNMFKTMKDLPAKTELSDKISKDLKKRGFKFVGSTIVYAHMQATGMVNDHTVECFRYHEIENEL